MKCGRFRFAALAALLVTSACSSSGSTGGEAASTDTCSPSALDNINGSVEVSLWSYVAPRERSALTTLINDFNREHAHIEVKLEDKGQALPNQFLNASPGERPDLVMLQADAIRPTVDQGSIVPVQACLDVAGHSFADLLPGALASAAINGVQWGVPFGASGDVLAYNRAAFRRAGLDPDRPPLTLDDVTRASEALVTKGVTTTGLSVPDPVPLFFAADVTPEHLDSDTGLTIARWLAVAGRAGLAQPSIRHDGAAAILDLDSGQAGMAIAHTTELPDAASAVHGGQSPGLELGVAALPTPSGTAASPFRSDALFLSAESSREARAAAWSFLTWLVEPTQQARFAHDTDFYPVNTKAPDLEPLASQWQGTPELAAGWRAMTGSRQVADVLTAPRPYLVGDIRNAGDHSLYLASEPEVAIREAAAYTAINIAGYAADPARYARCAFTSVACHIDAQLVVLDVTGATETAITGTDSRATVPSWSPDGKRITFDSNRDELSEIYVIDADGQNRRRLTDSPGTDSQPAWTPDGTRILFWSQRTGDGDIYSMAADGTDLRRLTIDDDVERKPAVSPDGRSVAYARQARDGNVQIWLMDIDGRNQRQLTGPPGTSIAPTWSRDGTRILFNSDRDTRRPLFSMNADGSDQRPLLLEEAASFANASPDGQHLAYALEWPSAIAVADVDGSNPRAITRTLAIYSSPSWSPDGQRVVAVRHRWPGQTQ